MAAASIAFCLLAIEGMARLLAALQAGPPGDPAQRIARYSPTLGWEKPPRGQMRISRSEYDVEIRMNAFGLRGPDYAHAKPESARRVLILGDSFAEGYYVEEPDTARAKLEALLRAPPGCSRVEVINGASAGYSTDQEYLFFEEEGHRYSPDVVVVFVYYNDLYFNTVAMGTGAKPKPVFDLQDGALTLRNTPVPKAPPERVARKPFHGSVALRYLSDRTRDADPRIRAFLARAGLVESEGPARGPHREHAPFGPGRGAEEMWSRTRALLAALRDAVAAKGARLLLLHVPARFEASDAAWRAFQDAYQVGSRWDRERVLAGLTALSQELGIPLITPLEALRKAEASGAPAYFPKDGHWNERGNALVAEALAPKLRELLACSP